jgi:anti-sigma-K factor RskA
MSPQDDNDRELTGDDALAAEYVLGVLDGGEREAAAGRIESDAAFARLVEAWEARFSPLSDAIEPVEPPAALKRAIDARLFGANPADAPARAAATVGFWGSLALWRGVAIASLVALAFMIAQPWLIQPPADAPAGRLVASLAPQESDVHYFVVYDARAGDIGLSHVTGERAADRDFELWVIEGDGPPASLGVIPGGSTVHVAVGEALRQRIEAGAVFAISLEPSGGSPTGQPTGPVVAAGDLRDI